MGPHSCKETGKALQEGSNMGGSGHWHLLAALPQRGSMRLATTRSTGNAKRPAEGLFKHLGQQFADETR